LSSESENIFLKKLVLEVQRLDGDEDGIACERLK